MFRRDGLLRSSSTERLFAGGGSFDTTLLELSCGTDSQGVRTLHVRLQKQQPGIYTGISPLATAYQADRGLLRYSMSDTDVLRRASAIADAFVDGSWRRWDTSQACEVSEVLGSLQAMISNRELMIHMFDAQLLRWKSVAAKMADLIMTACPDASSWMDDNGIADEYDALLSMKLNRGGR